MKWFSSRRESPGGRIGAQSTEEFQLNFFQRMPNTKLAVT